MCLGGANLLCGTGSYLLNLLRLKHRNAFHPFVWASCSLGALLHLVVWTFVVALFLGRVKVVNGDNDSNFSNDDEEPPRKR